MKLSKDDPGVSNILLSALLATLLLTAGCSGFLSDSGTEPGTTPTATSELDESTGKIIPANGTDLRSISLPENGSTTVSGELDGSDPSRADFVYEPIQFTAEAGTVVNITMQTESGSPELRLVSPNGTIIDITSDGGPQTAQFTTIALTETGTYTIEAASATPETTFTYKLSIERDDRLFAGPMSSWNETEKYLEFGQDFAYAANATANTGQFYEEPHSEYLRANATTDTLIIGYQWDPESLNTSQRIDVDTALQLTFKNLYLSYTETAAEDPNTVEDESWVPEVIYFYAELPNGELYRTNFLELRWAKEYIQTEDIQTYYRRYYSTNLYGPASDSYLIEGGSYSTTREDFPRDSYEEFTYPDGKTHGQRYYGDRENNTEN